MLAGFVPVTQLVGDLGQVEGDRQEYRVFLAVPVGSGVERVFQDPARAGQITGLAVQLGQKVSCGQYLRMVLSRGHGRRFERSLQKHAGAIEVTVVTAGYSVSANR
jgi:hypothetical protein